MTQVRILAGQQSRLRGPLGALGTALLIAVLAVSAACSGAPAAQPTDTPETGATETTSPGTTTDSVGTFTLTGEMGNDRQYHASVKLSDGRVMAVGGRGKGVSEWPIVHHSAEIYDPAAGQWTRTGSTEEDRQFPTIAELPDGRVLLAGGNDNRLDPHKSAEVWDPETGQWSPTGEMLRHREQGAAVVLDDGRVIVTGGKSKTFTAAGALGDLRP